MFSQSKLFGLMLTTESTTTREQTVTPTQKAPLRQSLYFASKSDSPLHCSSRLVTVYIAIGRYWKLWPLKRGYVMHGVYESFAIVTTWKWMLFELETQRQYFVLPEPETARVEEPRSFNGHLPLDRTVSRLLEL